MPTSVAGNVRAEVARRQLRQGAISAHLGLTQSAVSRRMNGETPWSVDELQQLAALLEVPVTALYGEQVSA